MVGVIATGSIYQCRHMRQGCCSQDAIGEEPTWWVASLWDWQRDVDYLEIKLGSRQPLQGPRWEFGRDSMRWEDSSRAEDDALTLGNFDKVKKHIVGVDQ
jgi:hypothetical protein